MRQEYKFVPGDDASMEYVVTAQTPEELEMLENIIRAAGSKAGYTLQRSTFQVRWNFPIQGRE